MIACSEWCGLGIDLKAAKMAEGRGSFWLPEGQYLWHPTTRQPFIYLLIPPPPGLTLTPG